MRKIQYFIATFAMSTCSSPNLEICPIREVSSQSYFEDVGCWQSDHGVNEVFLIVKETSEGKAPYFLSKNCRVEGDTGDELIDLEIYRQPVLVTSDTVFSEGLSMLTNAYTHAPRPDKDSSVLLAHIKIQEQRMSSGHFFAEEVRVIEYMEMDFESLILSRGNC